MPPQEAKQLAANLGIELEEHGFCKTSLENPVQTSRPGVFVCGAFGGPKDIPETVMEASAPQPVRKDCLPPVAVP